MTWQRVQHGHLIPCACSSCGGVGSWIWQGDTEGSYPENVSWNGEPNYASHNYGYYSGTVQSLEAHISCIAALGLLLLSYSTCW